MKNTIQFRCGGPVGEFRSTMKMVLIFLECVRDEGANDRLVIGDKIALILYSILSDNLSI